MMQAPTSSDDISRLLSRIRNLTPASIDLLERLVPVIERFDAVGGTGMIHIGIKEGRASKLRIDTEYELQ